MIVKCPRCGVETVFEGNQFRPFCSLRCKQIDMGNWIAESYSIPVRDLEEEEDAPPSPSKEQADK